MSANEARVGKLAGRAVWVSGAASGMGAAIARLFAAEGAAVALVDVQKEAGVGMADEIVKAGGRAVFVKADVGAGAAVQASIEKVAERFGRLDILVNCAGVVHVAPLHEYDESEWDALMGVNLKSVYLSLKYGLPHLRQQARSYVVNIASASSFVGQALTPAYTASKHAVLGLTRSIALDYAGLGLRCNCVCPGITDTPMLRFHLNKSDDPEGALAQRLRRVPTGVALQPEEIARAALFFACEDSAGTTGASLLVDGGYTAAAEWDTGGQTRFIEER